MENPYEDKIRKAGFADWNEFDIDDLVEHLENKFQFDSSGTAFAVFKLIEFYKENKK